MHAMTAYNAGPAAEETIRILIDAGCDINNVDNAGLTAYGLMLYSCNDWIIPIVSFEECGARIDRIEDLVRILGFFFLSSHRICCLFLHRN